MKQQLCLVFIAATALLPAVAADLAPEESVTNRQGVVTAITPEAPDRPLRESSQSNVVVKSPRRTSSRSHLRDRVAVLESLSVKQGEAVRDAVTVGGSFEVDGTVEGDLVVVLGTGRLGPTAEVKGDVVGVASLLEIDPAAKIGGDRVLVGGTQGADAMKWLRVPQQWFQHGIMYARPLPHQHGWAWALSGVVLLLYLLMAVLFPRQVQATLNSLDTQPGQSFLIGLLVFVLTAPALLLLAITLIGLVAMPFVLCAMIVVYLIGKVALCQYAGHQIGSQLGLNLLQRPLVALLVGAVLFCVLYAIPVVGLIVWCALLILGIGAVWKAIFRRPPPKPGAAQYPLSGAPGLDPAAYAFGSGGNQAFALLPRAGFWWRALATLVDFVLLGIVCRAMYLSKVFLLLWVAYHVALWTWQGTTVGGILCGLRIVRVDGSQLNFGVALLRSLASFFSFAALGLGFFWAGWSREKQAWHDKIADTLVVKVPRRNLSFTPAPPPVGPSPTGA